MTFNRLLLVGLFSFFGVSCSSSKQPFTLFNGEVTYCFGGNRIAPLEKLASEGRTGIFAIDAAQEPSLEHINQILQPYGRILRPSVEGQSRLTPSGLPKWKRQCNIKLPETALAYSQMKMKWVLENYDSSSDLSLPSDDQGYVNPFFQVWFDGDMLVHIEAKL